MLVLSRNVDESIVIGEDAEIEIIVVEIRGDKVRLGIQAPKEIPVHRREVYDSIHSDFSAIVSNVKKNVADFFRKYLLPKHEDDQAMTAEATERQEPHGMEDEAANA